VQSVVSYRLAPSCPVPPGSLAGSLNVYASAPDAFDTEAQETGLVVAAHASVAAGAVRQREDLEEMSHHLNQALSTRDVIGQAKGILMERLRIPPEDAFDALRRASQHLNVKLREVALNLVDTGEFDDAIGRA
jgi:ANTAR domain